MEIINNWREEYTKSNPETEEKWLTLMFITCVIQSGYLTVAEANSGTVKVFNPDYQALLFGVHAHWRPGCKTNEDDRRVYFSDTPSGTINTPVCSVQYGTAVMTTPPHPRFGDEAIKLIQATLQASGLGPLTFGKNDTQNWAEVPLVDWAFRSENMKILFQKEMERARAAVSEANAKIHNS
jgi:hypothetical protein